MDIARLLGDYVVWHEVRGHSPTTTVLYRWVIGTFSRGSGLTAARPTVLATCVTQLNFADG
ncbi:MAG TPA: hypothetical protein VLA19_10860 [Herpetosiphonaceae bacterium]|nr:hypothetical protein [Herpetosiphonaceae bacterium]